MMNDKPNIEDSVLEKLAEFANVPPDNRDRFRRWTRAWIDRLWRDVSRPRVRTAQVLSELAEYQNAIQKVRALLSPNEQELDTVSAKIMTWADLSYADEGHFSVFLQLGRLLLDRLDGAIEGAKFQIKFCYGPTDLNDPLRRRAIEDFLCQLIVIIKALGGWVTTSRTMQGGQIHLSKALDILQPYLPRGVAYTSKACEIAGTKVNRGDSPTAHAALKGARRPSMRRPSNTSPTQRAVPRGAIKR